MLEDRKSAVLFVVDDQEHNVSLLERILARAGFGNVYSSMDPLRIPSMLDEREPDLVLLDMHMPGMDFRRYGSFASAPRPMRTCRS